MLGLSSYDPEFTTEVNVSLVCFEPLQLQATAQPEILVKIVLRVPFLAEELNSTTLALLIHALALAAGVEDSQVRACACRETAHRHR